MSKWQRREIMNARGKMKREERDFQKRQINGVEHNLKVKEELAVNREISFQKGEL